MRGAVFFLLLVACSSSSTAPADGGADAAIQTMDVASQDVAQDAPPMGATCEQDAKTGATTGGNFKTMAGTNVVVRTPDNYDPLVGSPLIMMYAPAGGNPSLDEMFTGLTPKAKARGYLIAYVDHITPQATSDFTNAASALTGVTDRWCVDPKRIYLTGHSDGGSITEIITIRNLATPAAIAPSAAGVSGPYLANVKCPTELVPEMEIHSKNDGLFPVSMGFGADVAKWWAKCNGCDPMPGAPDTNGCVVYPNCMMGHEVRYCEGTGQHGQWPPLNDAMLDFFDRFKKP